MKASLEVYLSLFSNPIHAFAFLFVVLCAGIASAQTPTEFEQFSLQLINRARADQDAEAVRVGLSGGVNEGLPNPPIPEITAGFKQPLAFDLALSQVADDWSDHLAAFGLVSHNEERFEDAEMAGFTGETSSTGEPRPGSFVSWIGENLSFNNNSDLSTSIANQQKNLFIDAGPSDRGHRRQMLEEAYQLIGIGIEKQETTFPSTYQTQNFGVKPGSRFLTGVVFNDVNGNMFYTPDIGEPLAGYLIEATATDGSGMLSTTTWSSGGYSLEIDPVKEYDLRIKSPTGELIGGTAMTLAPGTLNFEYGAINPIPVPEPSTLVLLALGGLTLLFGRRHCAGLRGSIPNSI